MRAGIIKETDNYIVLDKPAGLATQTARLGEKDLVSEVKDYLASSLDRRNPYLAVINRLDQPVRGLVLMAKNERTAAAFSRALGEGRIEKYYRAEVYGHMPAEHGILEDLLVKDSRTNLSRVADSNDRQAKKAVLEYNVLERKPDTEILDIRLITGRHHQIRVQTAHAGCPLLGDIKYGNESSVEYSRSKDIHSVCLVAYKLVFEEPELNGKKAHSTIIEINMENILT